MGEFAYCVRRVEAQLKRVSNLYFTYFNRLKLDLLGVKKVSIASYMGLFDFH